MLRCWRDDLNPPANLLGTKKEVPLQEFVEELFGENKREENSPPAPQEK